MSNQISAGNVRLGIPQLGYGQWLSQLGLSGDGVIVANVDLGTQETHPDLVNRFNVPCSGYTCANTTLTVHGTHVAGIIAGDGSSNAVDANGFRRGLGVAPGASLIEQIYDPYYLHAAGLRTIVEQSAQSGAVISSNSWGSAGTPRGYDNLTMQVDLSVRDARSDLTGNQPINYVLAIMNGYGEISTQGAPDEAKNAFLVGSTNARTESGVVAADLNSLSENSGHGPALDGRTLPHIVAPGCFVDSTRPYSAYSLMCGTSMSAPHVSGGVALFVEKYRREYGSDPSPALVKAVFTAAAHNLIGANDANGKPIANRVSNAQGWGRLDLGAVLDSAEPVYYVDQSVLFTTSGQQWQTTLHPADPTQPVRLMLAYTDAAGHGLGGSTPAWNNDLDFELTVGDTTYIGNQFDAQGWSVATGTPDAKNNLEGIFLPAHAQPMTVRIRASNINSDGVPYNGNDIDQDFALVCYNCRQHDVVSEISKSVDSSVAQAGDSVVYSIEHRLLFGGNDMAQTLIVDDLPPELIVLPETVTVNGQPQPTAYDPATHRITVIAAGETPMTTKIVYETVIRSDVETGASIINVVSSQSMIGGVKVGSERQASARFETLQSYRSYLPVFVAP